MEELIFIIFRAAIIYDRKKLKTHII